MDEIFDAGHYSIDHKSTNNILFHANLQNNVRVSYHRTTLNQKYIWKASINVPYQNNLYLFFYVILLSLYKFVFKSISFLYTVD